MPRRSYLITAVLLGGLASLGIELTMSRLLQPFFGSSQLIWANVIGLTLIYLTIGYQVGGRLADRYPQPRLLGRLLLLAGLATAPIPLLARPLLQWSVGAFTSYSAAIFFGSFFGVLLLLSTPMILLGMIAPFAIRLSVRDLRTAGSTAGTLYAVSTLGSIAGTFLPVLVLVPLLGTSLTFYVFALALVTVGALGAQRRAALVAIPAVIALAVLQLGVHGIRAPFCRGCESLFETESSYNYIQVARANNGPGRTPQIKLILNEGQAIHSVYNTRYGMTHDPVDLITNGPWDFFHVAPYLYPDRRKADVDSLLLIGAAAGTIPKQFLALYGPESRIDAVEIDPAIIEVGRRFFAMEDESLPNYTVAVADGRVFLNRLTATYDIIGMDAYHQPYVPFHLATREFFAEVDARLAPDGVAVVNAGRVGDDYRLAHALASTMRAVFPQVFLLDVPTRGNVLVIGVKRPVGDGVANFRTNRARMDDRVLRFWMTQALDADAGKLPLREWAAADAAGYRPFTDDWAPVESVIDRMILRAAEAGPDE